MQWCMNNNIDMAVVKDLPSARSWDLSMGCSMCCPNKSLFL